MGQNVIQFPHVADDMTDLIDDIAIRNDADNLNQKNGYNLSNIYRRNVSVSYSEHCRQGEI